jgi:peptidoglycan/LPS O-acetylase OafA/YrhL
VIIHNVFPYSLPTTSIFIFIAKQFAGIGWIGVQWFFVLSGFLITQILRRTVSKPMGLRNFFMRRLLRIFPIYYITLIILFIVIPSLGLTYPGTADAQEHSVWFWTYTSNLAVLFGYKDLGLAHLWSLAVEEQFYLIWPFVILCFSLRSLKLSCYLLIVSAPLFRIYFIYEHPDQAEQIAYIVTFVRWDALAIGALLALALEQSDNIQIIHKYLRQLIAALSIWSIAVLLIFHDFGAVKPSIGVFNQTLAACWGALLIFICVSPTQLLLKKIPQLLQIAPLVHLGKYSYAMYLFHLIVHQGLAHIHPRLSAYAPTLSPGLNAFLFFILIALVTYLLARLSWLLIESPALSLKRYF